VEHQKMTNNNTVSEPQFALVVLSQAEVYFTGVMSPRPGHIFYLSTEHPNVVGRKEDETTICIRDGRVARQHCKVEWCHKTSAFELVDIATRNRTLVNGIAVMQNEPVTLKPGDTIQCGRTVFRFHASMIPGEH
jgi:predicted component of type VI protein secretion system